MPRRNAPVQTDVTYFASVACRRTKSTVSRSPMAPMTPRTPPGMQMRSSAGQSANVCVGTRLSPQSLGTGAFDLAIMWVVECGNLARTCNGPVRSSCVRSGKMTKPRLRFDMPWLRARATTGVSPRNASRFSDIVQPQDVGHRIKAGLLAARPMCGVQRAARENHAILGAVRKLYALGRPGKNRRMLADDRAAAQ
jgi:hypothetical protein